MSNLNNTMLSILASGADAARPGAGDPIRKLAADKHPLSPEETGVYICPACSNTELFTGIDARGYGGPDVCECDASTVENAQRAGDSECVCLTELRQDFRLVAIDDQGNYLEPAIDYEAFTGGGSGADIGNFTSIICQPCGNTIWKEAV